MPLVCARCGQENPDGFRFCGACGASLEAAPDHEVRKTVTVLFADIVGSTTLAEARDPEAVRKEMARWFEQARTTLERHGGTVEKFVGDAVMAVFGIPQAHEDDALRAVRAAAELRDPAIRIGVNTGQVVAGAGETLVTGDAVNVAARLEQAAAPGEAFIGTTTYGLVRDAVDAEPLRPMELKGKSGTVAAYRLLRVDPGAPAHARRFDAPLVGRRRELERLRQDFDRCAEERTCQLFTLLGTAGVGKSRLAAEFLQGLDARIIRGRCLHYGEGITYYPLVEVLLQLGADAEQIIDLPTPTEIALAARKRLQAEAAEGPLVVVFDDIQWAEGTFLDLVEHVGDWSRDSPIFLLCIARPELLELRPAWAGGKLNATSILLEPLQSSETEALIDNLLAGDGLDDALRARIVSASEGNPLYVEEMLAMLDENGAGEIVFPPTIQALLQARLDRLAANERAVIERGAVEGEVFHRAPVAELAPEPVRAGLDAHLSMLVRKELIRPDKATFPGDDAFRFRHLLIRDAAYAGLPKETRAELHKSFAFWLDEHVELVEQDEIVGYHLEQAVLYERELGRVADRLAVLASTRLGAAGTAAIGRSDYAAGVKLLERAVRLVDDERRAPLVVDLVDALIETARFDEARRYLDEAVLFTDARWNARARLEGLWLSIHEGVASFDDIHTVVAETLPVFESAADEVGLAVAHWTLVLPHWLRCRALDSLDPTRKALLHAQRARDRPLIQQTMGFIGSIHTHGPTPADEARAELEVLAGAAQGLVVEAALSRALGRIAAMEGNFDEARDLMQCGREPLAEAGLLIHYWSTSQGSAFVEEAAGNREREEEILREAVKRLDELGERPYYSTNAVALADCLAAQHRDDEALESAEVSRRASPAGDVVNFIYADAVEARILARRGELEAAERLAHATVERAEDTDFWRIRSTAYEALGEVLARAGKRHEARAAYEHAVRICEEKGAVRFAERTRALITEL